MPFACRFAHCEFRAKTLTAVRSHERSKYHDKHREGLVHVVSSSGAASSGGAAMENLKPSNSISFALSLAAASPGGVAMGMGNASVAAEQEAKDDGNGSEGSHLRNLGVFVGSTIFLIGLSWVWAYKCPKS